MDMLLLFMLFCSIPPFFLWSRRRVWALAQLPLLIGMWLYSLTNLFDVDLTPGMHLMLVILFYGNLVYTEAALVRLTIDYGNRLKSRRPSFIRRIK